MGWERVGTPAVRNERGPFMRIIERYAGDIAVLECHGPLRVPDAPELLHAAICRLVGAGRRTIILNLEDVPSIDAGGLGALVKAHMLVRGHHGRVRLAQMTPHVRHLLVMSRLADVFEASAPVDAGGANGGRASGTMIARKTRSGGTPPVEATAS